MILTMSLNESVNEEESFEYDYHNEYRHRHNDNLDILEEGTLHCLFIY